MSKMGEVYEKAMEVTTEEEARSYFRRLIERTMQHGKTRGEATSIVRENLGYFAGYYGVKVRERVERLYNVEHPIFGAIAEMGVPTAEESFELGKRWATNAKTTLAALRAEKTT